MDGGEFEQAEEVCGVLFVACGDAPEVLDLVEETLDPVAAFVEHRAEAGFPATMDHGRDVGGGSRSFDLAAQPVGIVSFVGEHDRALVQMAEQSLCNRTVAGLAGRQNEFERQAARVGQHMNLGRQSAPGAAHTAIRVAFFELAAC